MIQKLQENKNQILFIELAGLLHDIGKLSKAFLEYRQKWQADQNGYGKDPHDYCYLDKYEVFKTLIPPAFNKVTSKEIGGDNFGEPDFSIKNAVHNHVSPDGRKINKMLNAADGVDSAIDRNNPLWSAEQKGMIFRSNVFGYERGRVVTFESQEGARQKLYGFLNSMLPAYLTSFVHEKRLDILKGIKAVFKKGLADTTRPSNDTTLWEHSYAVASILKVLAVHNLFNNDDEKIYNFKDVKFGILGIGWDGMQFMSYGQKIGDVAGRKEVIEDVKDEIKKLIEYEYPIGNEIYSDDTGIYFIAPIELTGKLGEIWTDVEKKIYGIAAEKSEGEIQPHIVYIDRLEENKESGSALTESEPAYINTLTQLCKAIKEMQEKISYRYDSSVKGFKDAIATRLKYEDGKTICPICRLRPVEDDEVKKKVCKTCKKRRIGKNRELNGETVFIDEIVDDNRRAALILARFGLDDWLNGRMVRSLFVTEAKGLEREVANLGNVKQFEREEKKIKDFLNGKYGEFNYDRIKGDIDALFRDKDSERAKHTAFLYDQRVQEGSLFRNIKKTKENWEKVIKQAKEEDKDIDIYHIYNLLNAKTPTPSTILDVWESTFEFFQDISNNLLKELLPESKRRRVGLKPKNGIELYDWGKRTLEAEIVETKQRIELLYDKGEVEVVGERYSEERSSNEWKGKQIRIIDKEESSLFDGRYQISDRKARTAFIPCRTMTVSPNLFMAIVPAVRAVEISALIYQEYIEQFGKVMGRLPFSIGNIFFDEKMPMFVVLDAGKRMIANFDKLGEKEKKKEYTVVNKEDVVSDMRFSLKCGVEGHDRTLEWRLPHKLGNCEDDYHHPYFVVKNGDVSKKNYFNTIAGEVLHFTEIKTGDILELYPNYYDFEFLDSNARRYDINLDDKGRRKSNVADFLSKPFLFDELDQKIMHIWKDLLKGKQIKGITDTKLRNLQSLWLTKYQEWVRDGNNREVEEWKKLVWTSLDKEFNLLKEQRELLYETIESGLFFDTLELYLGILKDRIEK